jgi:hypothetical protein
MSTRGKRGLIGLGVVLLVILGVVAAFLWERRRHVAAAGLPALDGSGTVLRAEDLQAKYRDPAAFANLCADVQDRYEALRMRFHDCRHLRKSLVSEYDRQGQMTAQLEVRDRVHFEGEEERKTEIGRRQLLGGSIPYDPDKLKANQPSGKATAPFSKDTPKDFYRYELEDVEEIDGPRLLRIHFEPAKLVERSFKGWVWVDPATREPVRMQCSPTKPHFALDRFDMLMEYGLSENGFNQLRRMTVDVAWGKGFAFVSRHYRVETELSEYQSVGP